MDTRNVVVLIGRLVADPELRYLPNGTPVANFSIAVNRGVRRSDGTFEDSLDGFFDCELFGGSALTLVETCAKGKELSVSGSLRQEKFKVRGDGNRTVSRIKVRANTVAPTLIVAKTEAVAEAPAPPPAPQPA